MTSEGSDAQILNLMVRNVLRIHGIRPLNLIFVVAIEKEPCIFFPQTNNAVTRGLTTLGQ